MAEEASSSVDLRAVKKLTLMDSWANYYDRQVNNHQTTFLDEQCLYDHLLDRVRIEAPEDLINRFQTLFITGIGYSDYNVWRSVEQMIASPYIGKDFKFILNRSCHILINHWLMQPRLHAAIPELVGLFETLPANQGRSRTTKRLRELVQQFCQTEQYIALRRLAQVVSQTPEWSGNAAAKPLGSLIRRYPCLYEYNLLTEDSTDEQRRRIRQIRRQSQQQFDRDLARYATYRLLRGGTLAEPEPGAQILRSAKNPTLLTDRQLDRALHQFGGKIDGSNTYRDQAQRFITYTRQCRTYRTFKDDLYEYLASSIDSKYGRGQFNQRLHAQVQNVLCDYDNQRLNDVLLVGTCRKLLNFLVVESPQKLNHAVFVDLTGNLGITQTIGLLLKIVLICRNVKPYLERQFSVLFNHYETFTRENVNWLVESLEHLNVAFSTNFGTLSL